MECDPPAPEPGLRPAQALRLLLLLLLWAAWLTLRALRNWWAWLSAKDWRVWARRWALILALAAVILAAPKAAGLLWGRMMLQDAAEIAAMQSDGKETQAIERALRRRAFALGFIDILEQGDAIRIDRQQGPDGPTCAIEVDFVHRLDLYRWAAPPVRIHFRIEKPVYPKPPEGDFVRGARLRLCPPGPRATARRSRAVACFLFGPPAALGT